MVRMKIIGNYLVSSFKDRSIRFYRLSDYGIEHSFKVNKKLINGFSETEVNGQRTLALGCSDKRLRILQFDGSGYVLVQ